MEMPRLSKSVRKVVRLQRDANGIFVPTVIYKGETGKRKGSAALRPFERGLRRLVRAQSTAADSYLGKHNRSNQKRKDGWIKDFVSNAATAERKGRKTLTKSSRRWPIPIKIS
jgi:hypothetical protein